MSSSKNTVTACCFWSLVIYGIAILVGWVLGWCNVGANIVSSINQLAHIVLLVGVIIGGFFYLGTVRGKYRVLLIVLFLIGLIVGVLGLFQGIFKWW